DPYASVRQENWSHQLILGNFYQRGEEEECRFFEDRIRRDSDDTYSLNALVDIYLRKLRQTGDLGWLDRASETVRRSLASLPAVANVQAIMLQARVETEFHHFAKARDLAEEFLKQQPADPAGLEVLGDALLELGDYTEAAGAFEKLRALFAEEELPAEVDTRLAHLAWIRGDEGAAVEDYSRAIARPNKSQDRITTRIENVVEIRASLPDRLYSEISWLRGHFSQFCYFLGDGPNFCTLQRQSSCALEFASCEQHFPVGRGEN